jgi:large subunit ribosomal protein L3
MLKTFFGTKMRPSRIFDKNGKQIPVTEVAVEPCSIVQIKTKAQDGYDAVQLGFAHQNPKKMTKPVIGHLKKIGQGTTYLPRFLQEVRLAGGEEGLKVADKVTVDQVFQIGDRVKVTAISKSKGFQGGVKRHGFKGGPRTHGQSDRERAPGSIGQTTTPGRVYRGKRMAGRMGGEQVTITGLTVVAIDMTKNTMHISGLIPGNTNTPVIISKQEYGS